jgi:hypothetical protein
MLPGDSVLTVVFDKIPVASHYRPTRRPSAATSSWNGFKARGEVRFMRTRLGGLFSCAHGAFENPGGIALSADGSTVNGNAFLSDWYSAKGAVRFEYATIKGDLHGMLISKACL